MVIEKAVKAVKESSWAEKLVAFFLALLVAQIGIVVGMLFNLNREVGVYQADLMNHLEGHPDIAINDELAEIHDTMRLIADRLRDVEIVQGTQPNGAR